LAEADLVDAIEVFNAKTSLSSLNRRAAEFADEFGIVHGAGSDAHVPDALGAAFVEIDDFAGPHEFLAALASGTVSGHHWDEPRPWSPRIVPSVR
jgi:predicted metal-dependent phosphoesterase TrpH